MTRQILQINMTIDAPAPEWEAACNQVCSTEVAKELAQVPGLVWKIWIKNADRREAGGTYLFENEATASAYTNMAAHKLQGIPFVRDVTCKRFNIVEAPTAITRGPVK
jgi:hypothetical protein